MTTKPGEVYRVDLGIGGKVRMMLVVSREDSDAPRALSICAPITTSTRGSAYEAELPPRVFLRDKSFANLQGLQAIQHNELKGPYWDILWGSYGSYSDCHCLYFRHAINRQGAAPNSLPPGLLSSRWLRSALSHGGCLRTRRAFAPADFNLRLPPGRL